MSRSIHASSATVITRRGLSIPATMATQHPDHASRPFFAEHEFLSATDEVKEAVIAFRDLGCHEVLWDWQGTFVDESVVDRFYSDYLDYFRTKQLGRDVFVSFYLPLIWKESPVRTRRAYSTIISASDTARDMKFHAPAVFEVVIPMTDQGEKMMRVVSDYNTVVAAARDSLHRDCGPKLVSIIPFIEDIYHCFGSPSIISDFVNSYQSKFRCKIDYLRPLISRNDAALVGGLIPAVMATKAALAQYARFEKHTGIKVYPIIDAGSSIFRGGLSPSSIHLFLSTYPGAKTVTIQSAFRYDHDIAHVKSAIRKLNEQIPKTKPQFIDGQTIQECGQLCALFSSFYKKTSKNIAKTIIELSDNIPARRERAKPTEQQSTMNIASERKQPLPDSVRFTAMCYSLGIPPEVIGTGRGILEAIRTEKIKTLERVYPTIKEELLCAGHYLNKENLAFLCDLSDAWSDVKKDVSLIEDYLGKTLGPTTTSQVLHRNHTSNVFHLWRAKEDVREDLMKAARLRRFLG
ncbi:phosphoenolpyruvate carboxylase [Candidatus Woesearchaeota archaeon]|nr:phosphoenolpyruvate carboxylase [Candidatus Woesearchaeota archaeon]